MEMKGGKEEGEKEEKNGKGKKREKGKEGRERSGEVEVLFCSIFKKGKEGGKQRKCEEFSPLIFFLLCFLSPTLPPLSPSLPPSSLSL